MYAKIFTSIYDGTLGGDWKALVTFQQLLVLCDCEGVVDMTSQALAARTSIPIEIIEAGIASLERPDPDSRTPDCEGRRIERLDAHRQWGWRIVNYLKYRELVNAEQKREADRKRIAAKRATECDSLRQVAERSGPSQEVANIAHAEAQAEAEADGEGENAPPTPQGVSRFEDFWRVYPRKLQKGAAIRAWLRQKLNLQADRIIVHVAERVRSDAQWLRDGGQYIPYPATWLNASGWLDEYERVARKSDFGDGAI